LKPWIIAGLAIVGIVLLKMTVCHPSPRSDADNTPTPTSTLTDSKGRPVPLGVTNDAELLLARCGTPSLDDSTENDNPRPPIPSRIIEYKKQRLRFMYIPGAGATMDDPPPYQWKFVGITDMSAPDPANARVVSPTEALKRMPCFGGDVGASSTSAKNRNSAPSAASQNKGSAQTPKP
jgi:hypothetical protein